MDCSLPISSVHGILQVRILEWVAICISRDLVNPGIEPIERKELELEDGRGAKREKESLETGGGPEIFKTRKSEEECLKKWALMDGIKWC